METSSAFAGWWDPTWCQLSPRDLFGILQVFGNRSALLLVAELALHPRARLAGGTHQVAKDASGAALVVLQAFALRHLRTEEVQRRAPADDHDVDRQREPRHHGTENEC